MGRFGTEEEAIGLANNTPYGLGAGLHSSGSLVCLCDFVPPERKLDHVPVLGDANQAMRVSSALDAGTVSDLVAASQSVRCPNGDPPNLHSLLSGLGKPIRHIA